MPRLVAAADAEVIVARRLFGVLDSGADLRERIAIDSWLNAGESRVFLRTREDAVHAELRLEAWDGPAEFDGEAWQRSATVRLSMPTGRVAADQIDAGFTPPLFSLPGPGPYHVRFAIREEPEPEAAPDTPDWEWPEPEVRVLVQFWRA
ncbi:hypothetical protein ACSNOI_02105 [Actinomadura kijaniata]|uniref:hypothetical protein n=1 Tax=Actinomadura kijaniata TaxID=46161 RepID=UPI003F1C0D98